MDRLGRNGLNSRRLHVESLESRALLAGHSASASFGLATAAMHHDLPDAVAAHVASPIAGATSHMAEKPTVLIAHLTDTNTSSTATASAVFHTSTEHGQTNSKMEVEVEGGLANTTYDVAITSSAAGSTAVTLGKITTDASGNGSLVLSSTPKGSQAALPSGFSLASGDTLTITAEGSTSDTLSGTFAKVGKPSEPARPQIVGLKAALTDSTQGSTATGTAVYHTVTAHGKTHTELEISVTDATANSSLDVFLNGSSTSIGTITTDANGAGTLELTDSSLTIAAGDTITVGTLSGTFATLGKK